MTYFLFIINFMHIFFFLTKFHAYIHTINNLDVIILIVNKYIDAQCKRQSRN